MRVAVCDPPYPGQAQRYYGQPEVDHRALIARLASYDGWALCTGGRMLPDVLRLCPDGVRVAVWVKRNAAARVQFNPSYAYEAVIFRGLRRPAHYVRDWIDLPMPGHSAHRRGPFAGDGEPLSAWAGHKPRAFCLWLFELLGLSADDDLDDLFPGTGSFGAAWDEWRAARRCWPATQSSASDAEGAAR